MRDKGQEEKKPPKGDDTQNEEMKLSCLESRAYSFVAQVARLEVVRVPDSLRCHSFLFKSVNSIRFSLQKSKYFAHFSEESKFWRIIGDLFRKKTQKEETDLLCLGLSTHSFIASVAKLKAVKVSDFLRNWLDQKAFKTRISQNPGFEYFAHSAMFGQNRNMPREKSQEPIQSGKKFSEFDFYG